VCVCVCVVCVWCVCVVWCGVCVCVCVCVLVCAGDGGGCGSGSSGVRRGDGSNSGGVGGQDSVKTPACGFNAKTGPSVFEVLSEAFCCFVTHVAGFITIVLPAASAGAIFHTSSISGKFQATMPPTTPTGPHSRISTSISCVCVCVCVCAF
jgi:hypothetical protein